MMRLDTLYRHRFSESEQRAKARVWKVLCANFFNRYVPKDSTVLDIGAGYCEFINHIDARRRIAIDANPELPRFAAEGVEATVTNVENLGILGSAEVDVCFSSNFFEHLPSKAVLSHVVLEVHRILKPSGLFLVMGPNIRYIESRYWDYYDHHLPLTDKSVGELLALAGFTIEESLPRFMPYTIKGRLPTWPWLVRAYLALGTVAFSFFGKQFFVVGRKAPPIFNSESQSASST